MFLWLFKKIMKEVREQLVFQDHLVAAVTDWKNQIIAELKSDKNIIFIGVHCRNDDSKTTINQIVSDIIFVRLLTVVIVQEDRLQKSLQNTLPWRFSGSSTF